MERVGIFQTLKRFGDGGSPIQVEDNRKSLLSRRPKFTNDSRFCRFSPVIGNAYVGMQ